MKFTLFLGCNIPARVQQYDMAARAVLSEFGVDIADNDAFKCCGYPMRNTNFKAYVLSAARNLALAEGQAAAARAAVAEGAEWAGRVRPRSCRCPSRVRW